MHRRKLFCSCLFFLVTMLCSAQEKAVYTRFLEITVPANGTETVFNPPILRWPYQKGRQVKYDIQLSRDSAFPATSTIAASGLNGAIFNTHKALEPGKWFWKYRLSGKTWSPVQHFTVSANALPMVSPEAIGFLAKIPEAHPRILLDDPHENITALSKKADALVIIADAEKAVTEKILTEADASLGVKGTNEKQDKKIKQDGIVALGHRMHKMVLSLCQAYLLTGNRRYAAKSIDIAMEVARWDPKGISGFSDFTDGICMYDMALVFDTFYDQLSAEQKSILLAAITKRAGGFYKSWVNNIESKVLSGHVWQLLLNEFFKTSVALYKHEPEAADWLSYAYELFLARSPVLGGLDGGWAEGASYFTMNMETLIEIPSKIKAYTGFDFINAHPWYTNGADNLIYQFPAGSSADGYGDNTEGLFEPPASYAAFATEMARLTQNPKFEWYARQLQQYHKTDLAREPILRWFRLINEDKLPVAVEKATPDFPMMHVAKETGVASLHTDPANTQKDVMIAMRSSPFGAYGHILADQNTFNILYGGKRLFYRTGYKVAMDDPHRLGWSKHTKSQNGVLINGEGQPYSAEAHGNFSRFLQGRQLAYIKGDASHAYQSAETKEDHGVQKFLRHIVLLKPGIIIIYDELEAASAASWSWLIHSIEDMKLDPVQNTFTSVIENAKGVGKLWSSQPYTWQLTNKFDVPAVSFRDYPGRKPKNFADTQWHLKAINKTKARKIRFLSVIQVSADGKILPFKETGKLTGTTKLTIAGWEIEAALSYDLPPQLQVRSVEDNVAFAAYGNAIQFQGQQYNGKQPGNSKLVELVNGKIRYAEMGDEPVSPIR